MDKEWIQLPLFGNIQDAPVVVHVNTPLPVSKTDLKGLQKHILNEIDRTGIVHNIKNKNKKSF